MDTHLARVHKFTMIAKHRYGVGGGNDSLEELIKTGEPMAHMTIRISDSYYSSEAVLAAYDDLFLKATLDAFSPSDQLLAAILQDANVMPAYKDLVSIK